MTVFAPAQVLTLLDLQVLEDLEDDLSENGPGAAA
jgi:hypothetical protein